MLVGFIQGGLCGIVVLASLFQRLVRFLELLICLVLRLGSVVRSGFVRLKRLLGILERLGVGIGLILRRLIGLRGLSQLFICMVEPSLGILASSIARL